MCPVDRPVTHARGYALAQVGLAAGVVVLIFLAPIYLWRAARWISRPQRTPRAMRIGAHS